MRLFTSTHPLAGTVEFPICFTGDPARSLQLTVVLASRRCLYDNEIHASRRMSRVWSMLTGSAPSVQMADGDSLR